MLDASVGEDAAFEAAMEAGAADVQPDTDEDDTTVVGYKVGGHEAVAQQRGMRRSTAGLAPCLPQVLTAVEDYGSVSASLAQQGLEVLGEQSGLVYVPLVLQGVADDVFEANEALLERLLGVDDVDSVFCTCEGLQ